MTTIVDPEQAVLEAIVALGNADPALHTLFGRTAGVLRVWEDRATDPVLPVLLYAAESSEPVSFDTAVLDVQFACFAASLSVANRGVRRMGALLTTPAFAAKGLDVARNPARPPRRLWPDAEGGLDDPGPVRADLFLSFLITC